VQTNRRDEAAKRNAEAKRRAERRGENVETKRGSKPDNATGRSRDAQRSKRPAEPLHSYRPLAGLLTASAGRARFARWPGVPVWAGRGVGGICYDCGYRRLRMFPGVGGADFVPQTMCLRGEVFLVTESVLADSFDRPTGGKVIVLGGYAAKRCPRVTHNRFSPTAPREPAPTRSAQVIFDAGVVFEARVVDRIRSAFGGDPGLLVIQSDFGDQVSRTLQAIEMQVPVIVGGRLPNVGGRSGAPDVLIRMRGGYVPVDVKNHQTVKDVKKPSAVLSPITDPETFDSTMPLSNKGSSWRDDALQLAHYTRMLESLGLAAADGAPIGGIIGSDEFVGVDGVPDVPVTWYRLDEKSMQVPSAAGKVMRTPLEVYDEQFDYRVKVANAALAGGEMVRPRHIDECSVCPWYDYCFGEAGPDDASFAIKTGLMDHDGWNAIYGGELASMSLTKLAALTVGDDLVKRLSAVSNGMGPKAKLETLVRRAQMTVADENIELASEVWPEVPSADLEIDFDIEWDADGRIYQWGIRTRSGQDDATAAYDPVVSFEPMDDASELALAEEFYRKLGGIISAAEKLGKTVAIFHWHHVEVTRTRKFPAVAELLDGRTTDLLRWFDEHFFSRAGSSIKKVAPYFGFAWGVEDPGGAESQWRIDDARLGDADCVRWCLDYNRSDVEAQSAIRDGLRVLGASYSR